MREGQVRYMREGHCPGVGLVHSAGGASATAVPLVGAYHASVLYAAIPLG